MMNGKIMSGHRQTRSAIARVTAAAMLGSGMIAINFSSGNLSTGNLSAESARRDWHITLFPPAQAVPVRSNLTLEANANEGYQGLLERAEAIAQAEIDDRFLADITISRISLVVTGQNGGLTAPLLSINLDRADWRRNPDLTQYARYYPDSRTLLGLPLQGLDFAPPTLGTGDIQVTLRWNGSDDLDLAVSEPGGETVFFGNPQLSSGATLDVDANAICQVISPMPIENIFWPVATATPGNYEVVVSLFTRCDASSSAPIPFDLTILSNGTTQTYSGNVSETNPYRSYRFDVGAD